MKILLTTMLFLFGSISIANAGMFDDLMKQAKAKEMARVQLPLKGIQKKDSRIKKIETLAVKVAIKHKWKLQVACPSGKYCTKLKKDVDAEAWRVARSMVKSDYAAKAKLPKVELVKSKRYEIVLQRKGL